MTQDELNKVTQDVIAELKKNGTNIADASIVSDISQVNNLVAYGKNGKVIKVTPRTIQESVVKHVAWNDSSRLNDFTTAGVYEITGERKMSSEYDNLPIENSGGGHTISARLEVLDSSIDRTINSDDKCITQKLTLSNRVGGDGNVYIRTGRGRTYDSITWEKWGTLQTNINVRQVRSLDEFVDNGIYIGVWTDGSSFAQTFVMVVINDYAVAGDNKTIVQYKYAYDTLKGNGEPTYNTRSLHNGIWSDWEDTQVDDLGALKEELEKSISNEKERAEDAEKEIADNLEALALDVVEIQEDIPNIKNQAARFDGNAFSATANEVKLTTTGVNISKQWTVSLPIVTPEKAGVMSAGDKGRLEYQLIRLAGFSTANAVNSGDIVYNNNSSSSTYRKLRKYVGVINGVNTFEDVPFVDGAIYTYNNKLFTYNGTELIDVSSELRNVVSLLQGAVGENVSFYATYNSEVATAEHYINDKGSTVSSANFGYTKPIKVSEGEILTVQGLGTGLPYYVWATETGEILSIGDVCPTIMERKVMTLVKDGYIILNVRRVKASTVGAPYFCATISNGLLIEDRLARLGDNPIVNELKVDTGMSIKYIPNETDIAKTNAYISVNGGVVSSEITAYTKPIEVKEGDVLSVQGLGPGFPYYAYVDETGTVLSIGDICQTIMERKVMTLNQDGYISLNLRIKKATNAAAPPFEAVISSKKLTKDLIQELYEPTRITGFAQKEYPNADIDKNECYVAFYNAMMKKCADYGIEGAVIGGPAGYGLESWNGIEIERGKSNVDIYGLIKILGLVYGDWRLVDMWGEYDNPTLSIPIMRGTSIVNQEISSTLGRSQFSYILKDNYCVLAAKGGTHEGIAVNYSAACTCDALKGNVVIGYVNTNINGDTDTKSRYRAFKYLMDIAVRKFENRNSDVADLEELLLGQNVLRASAVIIPNTNPQLLHNLDFANSSYYKLYEYNPGMVDTMSTIKSLTAAVALDYINDLNTLVTIKDSDITDATGGTHPIFESGDKLTIKDLIYANSVRSSNQASYALARIIGQAILKNERL